jgi:hypothetical protein
VGRFWHPSRVHTRIFGGPWVASDDGAWRPLVGCDPRLCSAIPLGWPTGGARGTGHGALCAGASCSFLPQVSCVPRVPHDSGATAQGGRQRLRTGLTAIDAQASGINAEQVQVAGEYWFRL